MNYYSTFTLVALTLLGTGCIGGESTQEVDLSTVLSCDVVQSTIPVTINGSQEIISDQVIEVAAGDLVEFSISEEVGTVMQELYFNPSQEEQIVDHSISVTPSDQITAGTMQANIADLEPGSVLRYFLCDKNNSNCYPSCYRSQIVIRVNE